MDKINGLSDVLVSKFDADGNFIEQPILADGWVSTRIGVAKMGSLFLANSESNDFDVTENFGGPGYVVGEA
ncbi:MAG: hypothetical protein IPP25_06860 [Saprospiraceae bacterium]|nr:hypothetical protein [Candidatus Opimibacter skivensis]